MSSLPACYACASKQTEVAFEDSKYRVLRCRRCNLHFADPVPVRSKTDPHFSDGLYSGKTAAVEKERQRFRAGILSREILGLARNGSVTGNRLLDIGCGYGFFIGLLKVQNWNVYGCEQNRLAREHAIRQGLPVHEDLKHPSLWKPRFYDMITLWNVLEHVEDPNALLGQCRQLLRSGGALVARVPNYPFEKLLWTIKKLHGRHSRFMQIPLHLYGFSSHSLATLFRRAGYGPVIRLRSPLGQQGYRFRRRHGPVLAGLLVNAVECLDRTLRGMTLGRLSAIPVLTMIGYKTQPDQRCLVRS